MIRWFAVTTIALLLLAGPTRAAKGTFLTDEDVALSADADVGLSPSLARKLIREIRSAYVRIANHLGATTRDVFSTHRPRPFWLSAEAARARRITVEFRRGARPADRTYDAIATGMKRGRLTVVLPPPPDEDGIGPETKARLWSGMARAILAATMYEGAPYWLRDGYALAMAEEGSEGASSTVKAIRQALADDRDVLDVEATLETTDHDRFVRAGGAATAYGLVRLLIDLDEKGFRSLVTQSRVLLSHLEEAPGADAIRREHTGILGAELAGAGGTPGVLEEALRAWIEAGFPPAKDFRSEKAARPLKRLDERLLHTVWMGGRFGRNVWDEVHELFVFPFLGGDVSWRLPFASECRVWVGVRGDPGANYVWFPEKRNKELYTELVAFAAGPKGRRRLPAARLGLKRGLLKFGFLRFAATSPAGVTYSWLYEVKLK